MGIIPVLSGHSHLFGVSTIVFPLLSPPLSGHQALDTLSLALLREYDEGKCSPKIGYNRLWTSNASSVTLLFQNKVMLLLKIMLIYDEALLSGQPPLSGHMPVTILLGTLQRR